MIISTEYFKSILFYRIVAEVFNDGFRKGIDYLKRTIVSTIMGNKSIKCYNATIIKETEEGIRQSLHILYGESDIHHCDQLKPIEIKLRYTTSFVSIDLNESYYYKREGRKFYINNTYVGYSMTVLVDDSYSPSKLRYSDNVYGEECPDEPDRTNLTKCQEEIKQIIEKYNCVLRYDEDGVWVGIKNDPFNVVVPIAENYI